MENKSYQLRYLPIFEIDLLSTVNYITNVLKNKMQHIGWLMILKVPY